MSCASHVPKTAVSRRARRLEIVRKEDPERHVGGVLRVGTLDAVEDRLRLGVEEPVLRFPATALEWDIYHPHRHVVARCHRDELPLIDDCIGVRDRAPALDDELGRGRSRRGDLPKRRGKIGQRRVEMEHRLGGRDGRSGRRRLPLDPADFVPEPMEEQSDQRPHAPTVRPCGTGACPEPIPSFYHFAQLLEDQANVPETHHHLHKLATLLTSADFLGAMRQIIGGGEVEQGQLCRSIGYSDFNGRAEWSQPVRSIQEVLAGVVERTTYHNGSRAQPRQVSGKPSTRDDLPTT